MICKQELSKNRELNTSLTVTQISLLDPQIIVIMVKLHAGPQEMLLDLSNLKTKSCIEEISD